MKLNVKINTLSKFHLSKLNPVRFVTKIVLNVQIQIAALVHNVLMHQNLSKSKTKMKFSVRIILLKK
jgi:hypothetical protein